MKDFLLKYVLGIIVVIGLVLLVRNEIDQPYFRKFEGFDLKQLSKPNRIRGELFRYKIEKFLPNRRPPSEYVEMIVSDIIGDSIYFKVRKEFSNGMSKITQFIADQNPMIDPYQEDTLVFQTFRVFESINRNLFPLSSLSTLDYKYIEKNEYDGTQKNVEANCRVQDSRPIQFDNFMRLPVVTIMCELSSKSFGYNKYYYYPPIGHWLKLERARAHAEGLSLEVWTLIDYDSNRDQFSDLFNEIEG